MAKIIIDMSGRGGLLERYQGDLNDTTSKPHYRYLGADNQYAEGFWNPFSVYGYMSPATNAYSSISGTVGASINSFSYDNESDTVFLCEDGQNILKLDGGDDTSVSNYHTAESGTTIRDSLIYEVNNQKSLIYIADPASYSFTFSSGSVYGGASIGFRSLDDTEGVELLSCDVNYADSTISTDVSFIDDGTNGSVLLAQQFYAGDLIYKSALTGVTHDVSGVQLRLLRSAGTGSGADIKISLQGDATRDAGDFTYQGTWADATAYAINDTVEGTDSETYTCIQAHTSATATDRPTDGSSWEDYWDAFGAPDGTDITSVTVAAADIPDDNGVAYFDNAGTVPYALPKSKYAFDSKAELTFNAKYWIVMEEVGSNLTSSDKIAWVSSVNNNPPYTSDSGDVMFGKAQVGSNTYIQTINPNESDTNNDQFDFTIITNEDERLTGYLSNGAVGFDSPTNTFLHLSENGLVYWVADQRVHTFDGSLTGGVTGTLNESVLIFPSYTRVSDMSETRGRTYLGLQTSEITSATDTDDDNKFFGAHRAGVFIWDRRSQIAGGSDFYPAPGAKEIRSVFTTSTGDVAAITVNNSGFTELRLISGNHYMPIHTMEREAYPATRKAVTQIGNMTVWLGNNGYWYAYGQVAPGEKMELYKIGSATGLSGTFKPGAIYSLNENSSLNELGIFFGWKDDSTFNVSKWYPNGEGTIDSISQVPHIGNVYTKVQQNRFSNRTIWHI